MDSEVLYSGASALGGILVFFSFLNQKGSLYTFTLAKAFSIT